MTSKLTIFISLNAQKTGVLITLPKRTDGFLNSVTGAITSILDHYNINYRTDRVLVEEEGGDYSITDPTATTSINPISPSPTNTLEISLYDSDDEGLYDLISTILDVMDDNSKIVDSSGVPFDYDIFMSRDVMQIYFEGLIDRFFSGTLISNVGWVDDPTDDQNNLPPSQPVNLEQGIISPELPNDLEPGQHIAPEGHVVVDGPNFVVKYTATDPDGVQTIGQAESDQPNISAARAEVLAKLEDTGYTSIDIITIEPRGKIAEEVLVKESFSRTKTNKTEK